MKLRDIYNNQLVLPLHKSNFYNANSAPSKIIKDRGRQSITFNVMPDRDVSENVQVKEYRIWDNAIEAIFDRDYKTDMVNSPDHLTFLSSLVNLQKMVYVFMHEYLSIEYAPCKKESIKVWPGKLFIDMPKMVLESKNISHLMIIKSVQKIKHNRYKVSASTSVDGKMTISGEALIIVL